MNKIFKLTDVRDPMYLQSEGDYSGQFDSTAKASIGKKQFGTETICIQWDYGILSKHLRSYLPLHLMGNQFALDVELFLSQPATAMECAGLSTNLATIGYELSTVTWELALLEISSELCKQFNQIACDDNESLIIPFKTFHHHQNTITSQKQTVSISDACTDLRSILVVLTPNVDTFQDNMPPSRFLGSVHNDQLTEKVISYNFKVANNHIYNEPIIETTNNNESLLRLKNSVFKTSGNENMYVSRSDPDDTSDFRSLYENGHNFVMAAGFEYSNESSMVSQGISTGGHPVQFTVTMGAASPNITCHSFAECAYNLSIKNGQVSYVEVNDNFGKSSFKKKSIILNEY